MERQLVELHIKMGMSTCRFEHPTLGQRKSYQMVQQLVELRK
jgi:hypothetical protein